MAGKLPRWVWEWVNAKVPNAIAVSDTPTQIEFNPPLTFGPKK